MTNPQNGDIYILAIDNDSHFITVTYSKNNVARAWHGYSDICIGVAGGYGYDKESTVLAIAIDNLTKKKIAIDGAGVGLNRVKTLVSNAGGRLYDRTDMIEFVYQDIKDNDY